MSRTYRKVIKCGVCTGSNTEYYRDMNRKCRRKNNHELRNLLAHNDIEVVNDKIMTYVPIHDGLDEPTDGTYLIRKEDKDFYVNDPYFGRKSAGTSENFWNRKFGKYLKPKNHKHYRTV